MIIDTSDSPTPLSQKSPIFQLSKTKTEISSLISEINSHIFRDKYFIDEEHTILDLLRKVLNFFNNNDLIQRINEYDYQLQSLTLKYSNALLTIQNLVKEKSSHSTPKSISSNETPSTKDDTFQESEIIETNSRIISDYNQLKEDYLHSFSINQIYERKINEYKNMEYSYNILNNKYDEINNCYKELLEKFEIVSSQLDEKTKRTKELITQKDQLKTSLDYYIKYTDFSDKEKSKIQDWKKTIDEQISHYENIIKEKDKEIEKYNKNIHNLNSNFFAYKNEKEETIKKLNSQLQKLENKVYDAYNKIPQIILENIHQKKLTFSYTISKNKIKINYNESIIAEVDNEKGENYISPSNNKSGGSNSITLNNYISSSSSSGISNPHNITFLSNVNNKFIVVSNERNKIPELPISHFNSTNDIKTYNDYLINAIDNFTITSFHDEIPLHYKESLLSENEFIQKDEDKIFFNSKKCIDCIIF